MDGENKVQARRGIPSDSQGLFLPPPRASRRVECYQLLLNLLGLGREVRRLVLAHLGPLENPRLLHAGCGTGVLALEIQRRWAAATIEAVDHDVAALEWGAEAAEKAGLRVVFKKGYLQDLPCSSGSQDVLVCGPRLGELASSEQGEALLEFRRALKPGGRLLLVEFGAPSVGTGGWLVRRLAAHRPGMRVLLRHGLLEPLARAGFTQTAQLDQGAFGLQAAAGLAPA